MSSIWAVVVVTHQAPSSLSSVSSEVGEDFKIHAVTSANPFKVAVDKSVCQGAQRPSEVAPSKT